MATRRMPPNFLRFTVLVVLLGVLLLFWSLRMTPRR
jgi:hypothetical protein